MPRPLNDFGGWLKVFSLLLWIQVILGVLVLLWLAFAFVKWLPEELRNAKNVLFFLSPWTIPTIFAIWLLITQKIKSPKTPDKIVRILLLYGVVGVLVWFPLAILGLRPPAWGKELSRQIILVGIALIGYCAIWVLYFKKSRRVLSYYSKDTTAR